MDLGAWLAGSGGGATRMHDRWEIKGVRSARGWAILPEAVSCWTMREGLACDLREAIGTKRRKGIDMRVHLLKTWSPWFEDIRDGRTDYTVRNKDRDFREGDFVILRKWDPEGGGWGDEYLVRRVGPRCVPSPFQALRSGFQIVQLRAVETATFSRVMELARKQDPELWSGVGRSGVE